jgi:hypothetical protein
MDNGSEFCSCVSAMPGAEEKSAAANGESVSAAAEVPGDVDEARGRNEGISMTLPRGFEFIGCASVGALLAMLFGAFWLGLG